MQIEPLIALVITTYNGEEFLRSAIESAQAQSYKNLEIIITDDNSTDSTKEIIYKYAQYDSRIKINVNARNLGIYGNAIAGVNHTDAEYVAFLEQDDTIHPRYIEVLYDLLVENHVELSQISYTRNEKDLGLYNQEDREIVRFSHSEIIQYCNVGVDEYHKKLQAHNIVEFDSKKEYLLYAQPYGKLILKKNIPLNLNIKYSPGWEVAFGLAFFSNSATLVYKKWFGYYWRKNTNSVSSQYSLKYYEESFLNFKYTTMNIFETYDWPSYRILDMLLGYNYLFTFLHFAAVKGDYIKRKQLFQESKKTIQIIIKDDKYGKYWSICPLITRFLFSILSLLPFRLTIIVTRLLRIIRKKH